MQQESNYTELRNSKDARGCEKDLQKVEIQIGATRWILSMHVPNAYCESIHLCALQKLLGLQKQNHNQIVTHNVVPLETHPFRGPGSMKMTERQLIQFDKACAIARQFSKKWQTWVTDLIHRCQPCLVFFQYQDSPCHLACETRSLRYIIEKYSKLHGTNMVRFAPSSF